MAGVVQSFAPIVMYSSTKEILQRAIAYGSSNIEVRLTSNRD